MDRLAACLFLDLPLGLSLCVAVCPRLLVCLCVVRLLAGQSGCPCVCQLLSLLVFLCPLNLSVCPLSSQVGCHCQSTCILSSYPLFWLLCDTSMIGQTDSSALFQLVCLSIQQSISPIGVCPSSSQSVLSSYLSGCPLPLHLSLSPCFLSCYSPNPVISLHVRNEACLSRLRTSEAAQAAPQPQPSHPGLHGTASLFCQPHPPLSSPRT